MILSGEERWKRGIPHDARSKELAYKLAEIDVEYNDDMLYLKFGGDGDNGEELMYILDIYFELKDKEAQNEEDTI